ncbi:ATP-binding protein [Rhodoferax sp.]|uniref:ATP-binding protein n=1 Tax=Rhodoferax sp. TaxID=50421 RepID=UPI0027215CB7|nr:ATP-binding protein [Rhodoferax sp.]MDO8319952.1 hypothetical protein [Rhodoferax sp.]
MLSTATVNFSENSGLIVSIVGQGAAFLVNFAQLFKTPIFHPFYTTDHPHGMGLGTHLVHNLIVHRMSGTIQCKSQLGAGVSFHIEIPQ